MFEYIKRGLKHYLELLGSSGMILSSESKSILVAATERHELLHISSSDTKLAHEMLKESSSKAGIHSPSGDTDILLLTLAHLYEYKERIYIVNSHEQYKKTKD